MRKELELLRIELRMMVVGLVSCIERHASRPGLSSLAFRSSGCTASFHSRRESSYIDIEGSVEELLSTLRDHDKIANTYRSRMSILISYSTC